MSGARDIVIIKYSLLFLWNSNLTGHPIFLLLNLAILLKKTHTICLTKFSHWIGNNQICLQGGCVRGSMCLSTCPLNTWPFPMPWVSVGSFSLSTDNSWWLSYTAEIRPSGALLILYRPKTKEYVLVLCDVEHFPLSLIPTQANKALMIWSIIIS